ncbi:serine hydrolase family protein [Actinokineospora bangkokensis]|uniref:Uncharacterized protein n=1 Tax=Actinokineospora bangkokensis TaxID=1193682 RepID=A0A1Q9LM97_9PSEU|nr:hypothetical protein [Actinokineospora bangkokensis]OLR93123.1 hypothetical protein BJP25_00540 [Actinokineospora bangkokensis]
MKRTWIGLALAASAVAAFAVAGTTPVAEAHHGDVVGGIAAAVRDANSRGTAAAVSFFDRVSGQYADNGDLAKAHFGSASVVKVFIADDLFYRSWRGEVGMSDFDWQQVDVMLRSSDDAAASRFWSRLGGPAIVDRIKARYRLNQIMPPISARWWGLTRLTSFDMSLYYARMINGEGGLPGWLANGLLERMAAFTDRGTDGFYQRHGIPDGLPGESPKAVKQGWMCCQYGLRTINTTGVVGPERRFIIVVFAHDQATGSTYQHTQESVTRIVQRMFPGGRVPRPAEHNPFGAVDAVAVDPTRMRFQVSGWAIDPDTAAPITAHMSVGGMRFNLGPAAGSRPDLVRFWPWAGPNHGFTGGGPMPGGTWDVCGFAINAGPGEGDPQVGCKRVTAPQRPFGSLDGITPVAGGVRVWGWVTESELAGGPSPAHLYVDGRAYDLGWALVNRPDLAWTYGAWGTAHGFDKVMPVAAGTHQVCVRGVDLRTVVGDNELGCRTVVVP